MPPSKDPAKPHLHPTAAKFAPFSQPNYNFLRLDRDYVQPDILNPLELRNIWPAGFNSRFTDLGDDENRPYEAQAPYSVDLTENDGDRRPDDSRCPSDPAAPTFPTVPTQWLVRFIKNKDIIQPAAARERKLDDLNADVGLQVDVSPFVSATDGKETSVAAQAEAFVGIKTPVGDWEEKEKEKETNQEDPDALKFLRNFGLFSSSNQLFTDYQPHNSNVFSMAGNFQYGETMDED
ncbi:hypothetical protein FDENT_10935 [Fusarium denticulatum]|uniref:Uncharacterized protein n=1 Tax=Fusarium denticulatum TaxID=48507 RepID=A0A8H5THT8_9HYPO|nr:hypothetical protein FDENT_10935 [Fusarium denticulatum]